MQENKLGSLLVGSFSVRNAMVRKKIRGRPRKSANKGNSSSPLEANEGNSNNIPQTQDARRTRSIEKVQGIPAIEFSSTSAVGTPPQQRLTKVATPSEHSSAIPQTGTQVSQAVIETLAGDRIQWSALFPVNGHDLSIGNGTQKAVGTVKITFEDIQGEVDFWVNVVVCHVLGANPPLHVMESFVKRIWGNLA